MLGHRLPPHQVNPGKQLQESRTAGHELQIGNKQINLLFSLLPASVAVYHGKARMKKKKKNKKTLAKLPYCACIQILLCRILIHRLKLRAASEQHAPDTL